MRMWLRGKAVRKRARRLPGGQHALALGLLFAWVLCLPLAGPLLARASPADLGPFSATEAFTLAHGLALPALGLASLRLPRLDRTLAWWGPALSALGLAVAFSPPRAWGPLLAAGGVLSAGGVLAVGRALSSLPWQERPWAVALGAALANLPLYLLGLPEAPDSYRPWAALLALGPLALPFLLRNTTPAPGGRPRELPGLALASFVLYLVGGLAYGAVAPSLGEAGARIGVLPYITLLPAGAFLASRYGREQAGRAGPALLALGFALWAFLPQGTGDIPAQALGVGGFAFLDVFFWTAFADQQEPRLAFGVGLGSMVMAIFSGLMLSGLVAEREEAVALTAATILAVASVLWPPVRATERAALELRLDGRGPLSPREREALMLLARGLTTKEVAQAMGISPGTARKLLERAYRKLGARSGIEAVARIMERR